MKEKNYINDIETQEGSIKKEANSLRIEIEEYIEEKAEDLDIKKEDLIEITNLDLESFNNEELDQKNIDFIKLKIEESINELKEIGANIIKSYVVLKRKEIIKTPQEFEKMLENNNVRNIIRYTEEKNLEYVVGLYQIKTPQEFEKMCENNDVRNIMKYVKEKNLEYVVGLYQIKTPQEFEKMIKNKKVRYVIEYTEEKNLEYVVGLYQIKTPQEFEKMCENNDVRNIIRNAKEKNLHYAIQNNILNKSNITQINYESINNLDKAVNIEQPDNQETTFLKKLFNQHINAASNTLEVIEENENINIKEDHKDIFDMIDKLGNISPIIFEKYKPLDSKERDIYVDEINEKKREMFKNKPIDIENNFDETAELIYIAYNPIGMSFEEVKKYLKKLKDRTEDIKKYKFPEDGYEITIENPTEKVIKKEKKINFENIDYMAKIIKESTEKNKEEDYNKKVSEVLDKVSKASISLDNDSLSYLISIMNNENVSSLSQKHYDKNNINDLYNYLSETKEVLEVIFGDNFKEKLENFFNENTEIKDTIIKTFQEEKKKEAFIKALRRELEKDDEILTDEYWEDLNTDKISELLSTFIQNKIIKTEKGGISKELNKIEEKDQKEGTSRMKREKINLKVYVSKNIGSFFAKASAGISTSDNVELFNRKEHFHFIPAENIGKNNEIIRGNIQAYIIDDNGEESLLIRGINPNSTFLYEADEKSLCDEIIKVAIKFKNDNNLKAVYLSEQLKVCHALSNRLFVFKYLSRKYFKDENKRKCDFEIIKDVKISKMYKVG